MRAIKEDPNNYVYYSNIAAVYFESEKYESSIAACTKALELATKHNSADKKQLGKIHARMGRANLKITDFINAADCFVAALDQDKTVEYEEQLRTTVKFLKIDSDDVVDVRESDPVVEVRKSKVHGRGVFALKDIKKGQPVCFYDGKVVDQTNIMELVEAHEEGVLDFTYAMAHPKSSDWILFGYKDPKTPYGIGQIINDGAKPEITKLDLKHGIEACEEYSKASFNLWNVSYQPTGPDFWFYADRDIAKGEELYLRYGHRSWLRMLAKMKTENEMEDSHLWRMLYWAIEGNGDYVLPSVEVKRAEFKDAYNFEEDECKAILEEMFEVPKDLLEKARKGPKFSHKKYFLSMFKKISPDNVQNNLERLP